MKAFNKLSKVKATVTFLMTLAFLHSGFSQTLNPPQNLSYSVANFNDVTLFWDQPATGDSAIIHWDNGNNYTSWGFLLNPEQYSVACKWDPEHIANYDGWKIKKMRFYVVSNAASTLQLKIWSGPDATEIYSQDVTDYNINEWSEITLDEPVTIDASTQLWAGLYIDFPFPGTVIGLDEGPVINGYGNLFYWNGGWQTQGAGNWNMQLVLEEPQALSYLHWDSGNNDNFFGFFLSGSYQFTCAAKWNPEHLTNYDGWDITSMRFFLSDANVTSVKIKLFTGAGGNEVYSQDVTDYNINDWTEITLDTPFTIDATTELWGGVYIDMPNPGAPVGLDEGPLVPNQGFWLHYNGQWYDAATAGVNANMNLQLGVLPQGVKNGVKGLIGYNIYRNSELLNPQPVSPTVYLDENLYNGTYNYYVTAVYEEGESGPSNEIEVVINSPVVIEQDSLALVDLYNNCGGPDWNNNDEWLTGPISEWHGVTISGTRVTQLWLQINNLTGDLPESITDLTALQKLHVESNNITSMPDNIGDMEALTEFWIGWNPITDIPESIGNLTNLYQLHIGFTDLGELPESIGNLSSLNWLALGDAGLNSLPDSFGNLTALESCFLWGNNLTELPEGFGGCVSMKYLALEDNQLTSLPESFGNMTQLHTLWAYNNQLTSLPSSFGNLTGLVFCDLSNNQLTSLSDNFGNLSGLRIFFAGSNLLPGLPDSFGELATIDSVSLINNVLISLPENFGNMETLEWLDLSYNQLEELPDSFGGMSSLEKLSLDVNNLTGLPASFPNMNSLTYASIAVNNIESLPENIGDMQSLTTLNLNQNNLSSLPESIGELTNLTALGISVNNLTEVPESMGNLNITVFTLNLNNISVLPDGMLDNTYEYLYMQDNAFQFGTIEPLMGNVENFQYIPQADIGVDTTLTLPTGTQLSYTIDVTGENNVYKWYKDGNLLPDQTTSTLQIDTVDYEDMGTYLLVVTNTVVPDLMLVSKNIVVDIVTRVENDNMPEFKVLPNPATSGSVNLLIDNPQDVESVSIYSISGQLMMTEKNIETQMKMDISSLNKGVYILKIYRFGGQTTTEKLVVR